MNTELVMTATVTTRKLKNGFRVTLNVACNKFTTGSRKYGASIPFVGDVDHWIAKTLVEVVSDVECLDLHNAVRALEKTHSGYKNIYWNLLRGNGYGIHTTQKSGYYNSSVYSSIAIQPLIKVNKGGV